MYWKCDRNYYHRYNDRFVIATNHVLLCDKTCMYDWLTSVMTSQDLDNCVLM